MLGWLLKLMAHLFTSILFLFLDCDPLKSEEKDKNGAAWDVSLDYQMLEVHSDGRVPSETPSYSQAACSNGDAPLQFSNDWFWEEPVSRTSLLPFRVLVRWLFQGKSPPSPQSGFPTLSQRLLLTIPALQKNLTITWLLSARGPLSHLGAPSDSLIPVDTLKSAKLERSAIHR